MANYIRDFLWLLLAAMKAVVAFFIWRRKLHLRFPLFFSFLVYGAAASVVLYAVSHVGSYRTYFYSYWVNSALYALLSCAVLYEVFMGMFRPHHGLQDFGSVLFRWAGVVSIFMAITLVAASPSSDAHRVINFILSAERAVGVVQCGMLLFLILFAKPLGITRQHHIFGFTLGLGTYSCVHFILLAQWTRALFGSVALVGLMDMVAFHAALITWLVYALKPEPAAVMPNLLLKPQRWSDALVHASNPDMQENTVLLGIEDIVERTLNKTNGSSNPHKA